MQSDYAKHLRSQGAPVWVRPELLTDAIETWQPYYEKRLTDADSLEILLALSRLIDAAQQRMFLEN